MTWVSSQPGLIERDRACSCVHGFPSGDGLRGRLGAVNEDSIPWAGPRCPECQRELDVEPVSSGDGLGVAYTCKVHGLVAMADPFATG